MSQRGHWVPCGLCREDTVRKSVKRYIYTGPKGSVYDKIDMCAACLQRWETEGQVQMWTGWFEWLENQYKQRVYDKISGMRVTEI